MNCCFSPQSIFDFNVGGNGGRGGDVILECSPSVWDFSGLQNHVVCDFFLFLFFLNNIVARWSDIELRDTYGLPQKAGRGGHGTAKNMIGTRGDDKVI